MQLPSQKRGTYVSNGTSSNPLGTHELVSCNGPRATRVGRLRVVGSSIGPSGVGSKAGPSGAWSSVGPSGIGSIVGPSGVGVQG